MSFIYFYLLILLHPYIALWPKSFTKAGRKSWEALIPGYNYYVAFKITIDKPFWSLLLLFPGVHLVMLASINLRVIQTLLRSCMLLLRAIWPKNGTAVVMGADQ